jgi:hypothetical protein
VSGDCSPTRCSKWYIKTHTTTIPTPSYLYYPHLFSYIIGASQSTKIVIIIIIIIIIIPEKQSKYQELANEICAMWKQNTVKVIPIVITSTGVIPKSLSQSLKRLDLQPNTYIQMQKYVIFGTCLIVRNFLNYK